MNFRMRRRVKFLANHGTLFLTLCCCLSLALPALAYSPSSTASFRRCATSSTASRTSVPFSNVVVSNTRTKNTYLLNKSRRLSTLFYFRQQQEDQQQQQPSQRCFTTTTIRNTAKKATSSDTTTVNETMRNDLIRTGFWVAAAAAFGLFLGLTQGTTTAEEFFAGYLIEQSLSVDNLFVFLLLFESFGIPAGAAQQKVLTYGIAGAVVMRAIMIALGAAALHQFRGILLGFAAILLYSSFNLLTKPEEAEDEEDPGTNAIIKFSQSILDTTNEYDGDNFFSTIEMGKATPLLVCMIAVELSDIVFAVDSIPAVFGVTENPWVVFSSNLFAICGLRSLYGILSQAATDLVYLEKSVALVLGFIGSKMIAETAFQVEVPTSMALLTVATLLGGGVGLSLLERQQQEQQQTDKESDAKR